jgi:FixJ family two-component response regulator
MGSLSRYVPDVNGGDGAPEHRSIARPDEGMPEIVYIIGSTSAERNHILVVLAGEPVIMEAYDCAEQFFGQVAAVPSGCILAPVDLPGMGLRGLIKEIARRDLPLAVVVLGRDSDLATAVELVRAGASDFLEHPISDRRLRSAVRLAIGAET